jgi:hypothetical protein
VRVETGFSLVDRGHASSLRVGLGM